jgi:AGZA family xanthine/uracil permease-like MFS transporter
VILVTLLGRTRLPGGLPAVFASVTLGVAVYYVLRWAGILSPLAAAPTGLAKELHVAVPWPSLAFIGGLSLAWGYLPIAIPFAITTIVGGVDNTESAAVAGDEYDTRAILAAEGFATLAAGLCGGVVESTPYIGHPAYKRMGAGAGYAAATGIFIGLGGMLGYLPFLVDAIPAAAVAPILLYIGIEVMAQAFMATPPRHAPAVALAALPSVAFVIFVEMSPLLPAAAASLSGETAETVGVLKLLASGFIITAVLWGASAAAVIDRQFLQSAAYIWAAAALCLFGVIHSPAEQGTLFLPWRGASPISFHLAAAYALLGIILVLARYLRPET